MASTHGAMGRRIDPSWSTNSAVSRSHQCLATGNTSSHDWCNKGRGMCYPICGMVHIKEP